MVGGSWSPHTAVFSPGDKDFEELSTGKIGTGNSNEASNLRSKLDKTVS